MFPFRSVSVGAIALSFLASACAGRELDFHYPSAPLLAWVPVVPDVSQPDDALLARVPVCCVHGDGGSSRECSTIIDRMVRDGWPRESLLAEDLPDRGRGSNIANARHVAAWVKRLRTRTGAAKIDIVAHSMGGLSARYFIEFLDGADVVRTYVSLGTMHQGLVAPCRAPVKTAAWKELCTDEEFLRDLASRAPSETSPVAWTSISGSADRVTPVESAILPGATFMIVHGVEHAGRRGLLEHPSAYEATRAALLHRARSATTIAPATSRLGAYRNVLGAGRNARAA
ncbi:MAG: alpha/beta fold hydrolase [Myxococcales bacterium]|nr:alpha/beta fold hydrolase [Myxococcales bacterium]